MQWLQERTFGSGNGNEGSGLENRTQSTQSPGFNWESTFNRWELELSTQAHPSAAVTHSAWDVVSSVVQKVDGSSPTSSGGEQGGWSQRSSLDFFNSSEVCQPSTMMLKGYDIGNQGAECYASGLSNNVRFSSNELSEDDSALDSLMSTAFANILPG